METKIFNLIILDESGSMQRIARQAVDGVNETLQSISTANDEHKEQMHFVSLVTFNDTVKTIFDCRNIELVKEIKDEDYMPNCSTALYDAMGMSINSLGNVAGKDDKVLVTIITDGEENSSHEFSRSDIGKLVQKYKSMGWVFAFIGANQDVNLTADSLSIDNAMSFDSNPKSTSEMLRKERSSRSRFYNLIASGSFNAETSNGNFFENDDK